MTIADWVQVGRFVAGLDVVANDDEFLRADCAPRANLGNGHLTVTDWVQAGRYAVGLDPLTIVGGPTADKLLASRPLGAKDPAAEDGDPIRTLEVGSLSGQRRSKHQCARHPACSGGRKRAWIQCCL